MEILDIYNIIKEHNVFSETIFFYLCQNIFYVVREQWFTAIIKKIYIQRQENTD